MIIMTEVAKWKLDPTVKIYYLLLIMMINIIIFTLYHVTSYIIRILNAVT